MQTVWLYFIFCYKNSLYISTYMISTYAIKPFFIQTESSKTKYKSELEILPWAKTLTHVWVCSLNYINTCINIRVNRIYSTCFSSMSLAIKLAHTNCREEENCSLNLRRNISNLSVYFYQLSCTYGIINHITFLIIWTYLQHDSQTLYHISSSD
jgi:hypothetical protein